MAILAKLKTHNSTYNGDGNKQKGASIFFSDKFRTEDECLYKSDNGDLVIVKLVGKKSISHSELCVGTQRSQ